MAMLSSSGQAAGPVGQAAPRKKSTATVRAAFTYPPTETLRQAGYWSWPGSNFDAEGRQKLYMDRLRAIERQLGMSVVVEPNPLDSPADAGRFIADVKQSAPDGLLLIPFKKGHWDNVLRIIKEAQLPTVVAATLGVLLSDHIRQLHREPGVYLISAADDFDAVACGLRMIRTARWMRDARIVNIAGNEVREATVPRLETQVHTIPHGRFVELFAKNRNLRNRCEHYADAYRKNAKSVVEPSPADILDAARTYFALKAIVEAESADALMMECLTGLRHPRTHCPPCMGFMSLRDEGFPTGCQSDLSSTLTLMLVQQLFGKPGFQQNAAMDTERNLYFGSHCTSATRMNGPSTAAEPYELRNHAEAGWGCVPRVLFTAGTRSRWRNICPPRGKSRLRCSSTPAGSSIARPSRPPVAAARTCA